MIFFVIILAIAKYSLTMRLEKLLIFQNYLMNCTLFVIDTVSHSFCLTL